MGGFASIGWFADSGTAQPLPRGEVGADLVFGDHRGHRLGGVAGGADEGGDGGEARVGAEGAERGQQEASSLQELWERFGVCDGPDIGVVVSSHPSGVQGFEHGVFIGNVEDDGDRAAGKREVHGYGVESLPVAKDGLEFRWFGFEGGSRDGARDSH